MINRSGFFAAVLLAFTLATGATNARHPLDGLSAAELETVAEVLRASGKVRPDSRFVRVDLAEPRKQDVLDWQPGDRLDRQAFVAVRHQRQVYEGVVDLADQKLLSWRAIKGAQPRLLDSEFLLSQVIVRGDEAWQAAIQKRGVENIKSVFCFPIFPGYFDLPRDHGSQRLAAVSCYHRGGGSGLFGRPIEGLVAIVDYDAREVIELVDTGVVPIPDGGPAVSPDQPDTMPATGPDTSRIGIDGSWVSWDKWRFHLRIDSRIGPVFSLVSITDESRRRSVLYQGALAELFVPYMDPGPTWYFRTYLDAGEYGVGASGVPLRAGKDCPAGAVLVDAPFTTDRGDIKTTHGIACIFERQTGDPAWSHYEVVRNATRMRRHAELVVRFVIWLGNYDYVLDWIFTETGAIRVRVGATGIVQVKGVPTQVMRDKLAKRDTAYGRLIGPGLVAVNHDHFFNFRLDLDVDGIENSFRIDRLERLRLDPETTETPRKQIWRVGSTDAARERDARLNVDPARPAVWRVVHADKRNAHGNPASYQLMPGFPVQTLLDDDSFVHRRAAFTAYNLWVTPHAPDERFAAGKYPNRHPGGAGLPAWTMKNRAIRNTDIVLWYTLGMHHVVRAEDWPIMPTVHREFELRPFDFFDYNPTVR